MDEQEKPQQTPAETNTELAKERTMAASERTMMAWVRTALSLIGFGIGIYEVADKTGGASTFKNSKLIGLAMIILGIISMFLAIRDNRINHKKLLKPGYTFSDRMPLGIYVGYALIVIAVLAVVNIIYKLLT
jgi:putative membrane protein